MGTVYCGCYTIYGKRGGQTDLGVPERHTTNLLVVCGLGAFVGAMDHVFEDDNISRYLMCVGFASLGAVTTRTSVEEDELD